MTRLLGWLWRAFLAVLAHRATLGLAALLLAGSAVWGRFQFTDNVDEEECRADIAGALESAAARSQLRLERGLVAVSRGDDVTLEAVADQSDAVAAAFEELLDQREHAVDLCGADADTEPITIPAQEDP